GLVVGGLAALLLAGGGAAVVMTQNKPAPPKTPVVSAPVVEAPKPAPPAEAPKPVVPAKPSQFTMSINTQPAGAEVFNGVERLGTTPCNVVLPASETPVELMLKKKGFKEQALKLVPDKDHDFLVDLMSAARPHAAPSRPSKGPAPTVAAPAAKPEAAKPEQPKPAGKLRDLKDPFAN
ncbi:MAG TPA: PEGA domain-containing protein, partial [Polyangia bacterium]